MSDKIYNNFRFYLLGYLIFISLSSILFLKSNYMLDTNNSMAEWVINYKGGFGRRGLFGELFTYITDLTNIYLKDVVLYFLIIIILIYHSLLFFFLRNLKFNITFVLVILSPLFVIFPIAELEALGRKDILIPLLFLIFSILFDKLNFIYYIFFLIVSYTIILLTHEVSIFYLPFFYFLILYKAKNLSLFNFFLLITVSIYFLLIIYKLSKSIHTDIEIQEMCNILNNIYNTKCGLGAFVLNRSLSENISELFPLSILDIFRAFCIFALGFFGLILGMINNKTKYYFFKFSKKINIKHIFFIIFIPTMIPFFIAVDWGRWFNLSYSMSALFYFFCIKNNIIVFEYKNSFKKLNILFRKKYLTIIFLVLLCFSWNPKAIHLDDLGSIPIYRIIGKLIKYYN